MTMTQRQPIAGTTLFDGVEASKGYGLNKMCFSFNSAENRHAFLADEAGYCARYGLTEQQRRAIRRRHVLALIEAGGNIYYLAKFAGIFHLDMLVYDPGALTRYSNLELVRLAGSQGVELLMWLAARGALHASVTQLHSNYHIPISNTASAVMLLDNAA